MPLKFYEKIFWCRRVCGRKQLQNFHSELQYLRGKYSTISFKLFLILKFEKLAYF